MSLVENPSVVKSEQPLLAREGLTIIAICIAIVLALMNTSMFNLALPNVILDFKISSSIASWIVSGYSIMFAVSSITFSRLSDFVPLRRLLVIGVLALGTASLVGFFSDSFLTLILCRIVQAAGAGGVISLSMVLYTRYIPIERRGAAMAINMSAVSLGLGSGPVVGGFIVENLGWHWLFILTSVVLLLLPLFVLLLPKELPRNGSFDFLGVVLLALGTTFLLLFTTNQLWIMLIAGLIALILFVIRIHKTPDPFVLPSLFKNRRFLVLVLLGITGYICNFSTLFLLPQILTQNFHFTPGNAGLIIFPGSLLAIISSRKVGRIIDRYGNNYFLKYGPIVLLFSSILFAFLIGHSWVGAMITYMILSLAFTALSSCLSNEISRVLDRELIGSGMGLYQLLQFFSGAFGIAIVAIALEKQHQLTLAAAYSNIYWGLSVLAVVGVSSTILYRKYTTITQVS
ncbi:MFS transporter [Priestia megaterium]|uniref:MFS transporter n=1 Tax=Priestia megaterium TaxID=1404 RepID=UPI00186916F9|nr:MFS transporter [Priestia megaterium]MBE2978429.1 MFS transporter [Priestia megaterium]